MKTLDRSVAGIIFPNSYDSLVPEVTGARMMASVPFAARYRLVDFQLSSMSNSGIDDVNILVNRNYNSLIDHIGSAREWDLVRKSGGVHIMPPYSTNDYRPYVGRVTALAGILDILRGKKQKYIIMTDSNIAYNIRFDQMLEEHIASGADISLVYHKEELPDSVFANTSNDKGLFYTFEVNAEDRIVDIGLNPRVRGIQNFGMNIYICEREFLIKQIDYAYMHGIEFFERDLLLPNLDKLNIHGINYEGYIARISDLKRYFDENMKLLEDENLDALFGHDRIYTKVRDDNPTRYVAGCKVENVMAADGCCIEGEVENSLLFRGVVIEKGAKVRNCILMQDTVVKAGAELDYVITDKKVTITENKKLSGTDSFPVYVSKWQEV